MDTDSVVIFMIVFLSLVSRRDPARSVLGPSLIKYIIQQRPLQVLIFGPFSMDFKDVSV